MLIQQEIVINKWDTSYFDNLYDDGGKFKQTIDRKKQISTTEFINKITQNTKLTSLYNEILPSNCRYATTVSNYKLYIIEEPPQMRTMFLNYDMSMIVAELKASGDLKKFGYEKWFQENKKPYKFYLAFPYIIYMIVLNQDNSFKEMKIFSRVTPINHLGDYTCKLPLMNINSNQQVCMGTVPPSSGSITDTIGNIIRAFWKNTFNSDFIYNVQAYSNIPFVCNYLTWQYHSQHDPMFIYNVEWIPYKTITHEIIKFKNKHSTGESDDRLSTLVHKVFYKTTPTHKKDKNSDAFIYDNVADSINIDRMPIFVNDSFILKKKRYFVKSFMSTRTNSRITHIKLQDDNKGIKIYKLTTDFKKLLRESIMRERFIQLTTLPSGEVIKQGSIIKFTNVHGNEIYNKIMYMRYGIDGKIEARIKSSLVALEDIKNIKVMDMNNIKINGVKIEINTVYDLLFDYSYYHRYASCPVKIFKKLKLTDIDISNTGKITTQFTNVNNGDKHTAQLEALNKQIFNKKKLKKISSICRLGTSMIYSDSIKINTDMPNYLLMNNLPIISQNYNETLDVILKDKQHLFIESFDMDLSFKVGDKVVTSNWINPIEMLKVKTVTGFITRDEYSLNVLLEDQRGNKSEHTYLYKSMDNFTVNVGTLRHIEKKYNGLTSGIKIKANKPGITNFPMKDVNIIIGFLTDTGSNIPLVLCSNGATLWADDLQENFNLTPMSDKKWKSMNHTPIMDQKYFKFQPGDMTTIPFSIEQYRQNLLNVRYFGDKLSCQYLTGDRVINPRSSGIFSPELKSVVNRIGFLNPRYSQKQSREQNFITAYPNFHGMYNFNKDVRMKYYVDERRILNVSDLPI